ncbi:GNAT family N-acetyltransferase [Roseateles sp.]|uniref:GNAT family N-acetyltransferase n=1 Tax=Roseateles sp. TaxID=1971397 RepID=UPI0039481690
MMQIRALGLDDLLSLLALYGQLHPQDSVRPSGAVARAAFAHPGLTHYGGFVDGQLVASCNLAVIPNLTRGGRAYGVIENVITDAAHRGQGRGRALIAHALQQAWALDCYKVVLTTSRKDPAVLAFYERCGFDRHDKTAFVARPPARS